MDLDVLTETIDHLMESGPSDLTNPETIEDLYRQFSRFKGFRHREGAAFDTSGNWVPKGASNASMWLAPGVRGIRRRIIDDIGRLERPV